MLGYSSLSQCFGFCAGSVLGLYGRTPHWLASDTMRGVGRQRQILFGPSLLSLADEILGQVNDGGLSGDDGALLLNRAITFFEEHLLEPI